MELFRRCKKTFSCNPATGDVFRCELVLASAREESARRLLLLYLIRILDHQDSFFFGATMKEAVSGFELKSSTFA